MEEAKKVYNDHIEILETEIDIKNEGIALAYKVKPCSAPFDVKLPDWIKNTESDKNILSE